ncbi:hypothetical protein [Rubripirellula lacrimiformis]|uniref:hypothetical protein n=1 Tax=Rubripirellula lacrimiformis TaxID=1930273 RepID=UPI001C54F552|nr:hypothetical protein [Rubripirellula lacrimiformis]
MDDERTGEEISLDVHNDRFGDNGERAAEARSRADVIKDGVQRAIAAAAGRR